MDAGADIGRGGYIVECARLYNLVQEKYPFLNATSFPNHWPIREMLVCRTSQQRNYDNRKARQALLNPSATKKKKRGSQRHAHRDPSAPLDLDSDAEEDTNVEEDTNDDLEYTDPQPEPEAGGDNAPPGNGDENDGDGNGDDDDDELDLQTSWRKFGPVLGAVLIGMFQF